MQWLANDERRCTAAVEALAACLEQVERYQRRGHICAAPLAASQSSALVCWSCQDPAEQPANCQVKGEGIEWDHTRQNLNCARTAQGLHIQTGTQHGIYVLNGPGYT